LLKPLGFGVEDEMKTRACIYCGSHFVPDDKNDDYCSEACLDADAEDNEEFYDKDDE